MSYSVNWITKVITVPTADLTLVSGTRYSLDMADCLAELRRLEWEFADGLWAPAILFHTDTRVDFAGATYAPFDDFLNGYTLQITGVATRVDLLGSNNDLIDILIPTGVSVVPSNSAGLQIVTTGSGVTEQDKLDIADRTWEAQQEDHVDPDTFGGSLATKSDVAASSSTAYYSKTSASIIAGTDTAGSTTDIDTRDASYWQVTEALGTGLTMEFVFNLATAEEKAGSFQFFGRYSGAPASHYINLWAWNVVTSTWELMHTKFVDNTAQDLEAFHLYNERHIDRATGNKVIMRMVHNVTGYSSGHDLYIDSVSLSSVSTVTGGGGGGSALRPIL